jgi:L-2,4-diaminobutyrate transaminase
MTETTTHTASAREADQRTHLHPFTSAAEHAEAPPKLMVAGDGIHVRDDNGKTYLDAMSGLWCVNVGYGRDEIVDAAAQQARRLPYYHTFAGMANEPVARLADRLISLAPGNMSRVFFGSSGSDTNDTQVKIVRYYHNVLGKPEKKKIIGRLGGYHGSTMAGASLSGLPHMHAAFDLPLPGFLHVDMPHYWRHAPDGTSELEFSQLLAQNLEQCIVHEGQETVAAFIVEPVQGAAGVIPPPEGYFEAIVPILRKYDILFIVDEVICGFGRLGAWWGSNVYGLEPDLVSAAKGLTSGYVPMSACIISEKVWEVLREGSAQYGPFAHGYTYSGHPVGAAAALANLDIIEGEGLVENAAEVGAYFQASLREAFADHPLVGEIRGLGLMAGIELVEDRETKKAFDPDLAVAKRLQGLLMAEGLICRPVFNTLAFSPPLILSKNDVDSIVAMFSAGLKKLTSELGAGGA